MAKARIERYNGEPAIIINGEAFPPMTATITSNNDDYYKRLNETGIKIFYADVSMRWNKPGGPNEMDGVTDTLYKINQILTAVPDAYIMIRLNVNPSIEWINAHPEEQVLYNDGKHYKVWCWGTGDGECDGMYSLASKKWREDGANAIREYFAEISQSPMFDRVIGYFLCAGGTAEWYYPGDIRLQSDTLGIYADFSAPFRESYSKYLINKYGTVENLRHAWNREDANFENPIIPDLSARSHIYQADAKIRNSFKRYADMKDVKVKNGVFVEPENIYSADFFDAINDATADSIVHFATVLKELNPELLVGAFYGYFGCTDYYGAAHTTGVLTIMDSGVVDFLAGPNVYNNREPGGVAAQREMQDSFRIRNMIYISEDDTRTHRSYAENHHLSMRLYDVEDSITILKRDFARDLCEDIQGWWFDMAGAINKPDWYDDPKILSLFTEQQEIAKLAYSLDRTKKNEIAVIYDNESVHLVSDYTDKLVLDFFRTSDLHRIGAPIDYYYHNDLSDPRMPDYKLYIMLNCYCLTDKEREEVFAKARKNHATVLWLYAPGYVNTTAPTVMDIENIEKTVGMKLSQYEGTIFPNFNVDSSSHEAVSLAKPDKEYGFIDRNIHSNIWLRQTELELPYLSPAFSIVETDGVEVLGRYCADKKPAFALKEQDGFVSAYCTTQVIRNDLIMSLAKYSGCHIYTESEDVLFANENFVAIHASSSGKRRITFKKPCTPYEVYEKQNYGENVEFIDIEMKLGETKMFYLK